MGACCLSGKVHEGKPVGREDQIGGLPVYVTEPKDGSKAKSVIFITDSWLSPSLCMHCLADPSRELQSSDGSSLMFGSSPTNMPKPDSIVTFPTSKMAILSLYLSSTMLSLTSRLKRH